MVLEAEVTRVVVQVIFWCGIAAPIVVATFWRWWRSELGWSICAMDAALSLALLPAMFTYWLGRTAFTESHFLRWFGIVALAAVPFIVAWRVTVIFRAQRKGANI